jgi:hypothetical protein
MSKNILKRASLAFKTLLSHFTKPLHIEFNLTDHCNLNCRGCSHYSPLAPEEYQPIEELKHDMEHISEIKNVHLIREVFLIGGETLLYPHLNQAMKLARHYFSHATVRIFTNGIKLPKMDDEFWQLCRELNVIIDITRYPIKFDYDSVEQLCNAQGVKYRIFGDRSLAEEFFRFPLDTAGTQNKWISHFKCYSFGCITINHSRIYACSQCACIEHLNQRFGYNFRTTPADYIAIKDLTDARQILKLRNRPTPFCSYCKKVTVREYAPSRREASEWVD